MRFLLDENVHQGLVPVLTGLGHEPTICPKGLSNGAVFAAARSAQRILLTHDKDFAEHPPIARHPGIILLKILPQELGQLTTALQRLLADKPAPELFVDRLFLVFPDRHDEFPFTADSVPLP